MNEGAREANRDRYQRGIERRLDEIIELLKKMVPLTSRLSRRKQARGPAKRQITGGKMKFHIHVYQIAMKGEVNIDAKSEREAREKALKMAQNSEITLRFPDCGALAIAFLDEKLHRPPPDDDLI